MWQIEFASADFLPELSEDAQQNPGVYGFELALWLAKELQKANLFAGYPEGEDWGWHLTCSKGNIEVMIGCSSIAQEYEGYSGKPITWSIFIKPYRSFGEWIRRDKGDWKIPVFSDAVLSVLADKGITPRNP
jgi:hypothetical protein